MALALDLRSFRGGGGAAAARDEDVREAQEGVSRPGHSPPCSFVLDSEAFAQLMDFIVIWGCNTRLRALALFSTRVFSPRIALAMLGRARIWDLLISRSHSSTLETRSRPAKDFPPTSRLARTRSSLTPLRLSATRLPSSYPPLARRSFHPISPQSRCAPASSTRTRTWGRAPR